jgi:multidrug resistance efflux pump
LIDRTITSMQGKWLLISVTAVLLGVAAGAVSLLWQSAKAPIRQPPAADSAPTVFTGSEVSLPGKVRARHVISIAVPIEGTIEVLLADVGQQVYQGELLGRIKNTGLEISRQLAAAVVERAQSRLSTLEGNFIAARLEASRAQADAARSRAEYERTEKIYLRQQMLVNEGATPRLTFEKAQKEYELAQSEYQALGELARQAEERVSSLRREIDESRRLLDSKNQDLESATEHLTAAEIHSPADGLVVGRSKQPGDEVESSQKDLFQIAVNLTALEAVLEPEPPVLARARAGQEAIIHAADLPGEGISGAVREIKDNQVIVEFDSPGPVLRPDQTVQVRIKLR